ncbi:MAG: metal ABC transporter permease [Beijerinckiaceae bacterium]|jgi:manganese/iron transport system permease protein|nr:metal ABC transporter permease [Beijerinckiaceae bacterium]
MIGVLLEPFGYGYMVRAIWVSALVGGVCAFLSCYLILKGWALMGDALSHSVVPGVAVAYLAGLPYAIGAFTSGLIAALGIVVVKRLTLLREDAVIGLVFTSFFAAGLLLVSINPTAVNLQAVIFGNVLAISDEDVVQVAIIAGVSLAILGLRWKDMMLAFFDESHARSVGLEPLHLRVLFFVLLSACTVAALQTVGAILVIAMVVTPGATAYLLTDRFGRMVWIAVAIGAGCSAAGAYASYFVDGATGGLIVLLQTALFLVAFVFAPKHGRLAARRAARQAPEGAVTP